MQVLRRLHIFAINIQTMINRKNVSGHKKRLDSQHDPLIELDENHFINFCSAWRNAVSSNKQSTSKSTFMFFNTGITGLILMLMLAHLCATAQNRLNVALELSLYNEGYAAHPVSLVGELQFGKKKRMFFRTGINANNRNVLSMGVPLAFGFYTHPTSKNHFEMGLGTALLIDEQQPPYNADKKWNVGPNGIMIPLAYRRELPLGWYLRFGLTPFLSFDSSIVPSFAVGYRVGSAKRNVNP